MIDHKVRVHHSDENLPRESQLAWKIATVALDALAVSNEVTDMVINRDIDNAAVAVASLIRSPVVAARAQATRHRLSPGATVVGTTSDAHIAPE